MVAVKFTSLFFHGRFIVIGDWSPGSGIIGTIGIIETTHFEGGRVFFALMNPTINNTRHKMARWIIFFEPLGFISFFR